MEPAFENEGPKILMAKSARRRELLEQEISLKLEGIEEKTEKAKDSALQKNFLSCKEMLMKLKMLSFDEKDISPAEARIKVQALLSLVEGLEKKIGSLEADLKKLSPS